MKRKFFAFVLLLAATISLSSCLSSDDDTEVVYSHDTAISAFSLGSMTRTYYLPKKQKDTTVTVAGSDYQFDIDHIKRTITNADSLPVGTRTAAALATISAKNSSYIQLLYKDKDAKDSLVWYSSTDSINFDKLQGLRAYSQDGSVYADYKLEIRVHKEEADSFLWHSVVSADASLAALSFKKAVTANGKVYVFGKAGNELKAYQWDGSSWTEQALAVSQDASYQFDAESYKSVAVLNDVVYLMNVADGKVFSLQQGAWKSVGENGSLVQLIGAGSKRLYAYAGTRDANGNVAVTGIMTSADGATWTPCGLDNEIANLPTDNVNMTISSIRSTNQAENLLLLGSHEGATTLWNCTTSLTDAADADQWNYVAYDANQSGKLPDFSQVVTSTASDGLVALGSNGKWYKSVNSGITWAQDTLMTLPTDFNATMPFALVRACEKATASSGETYDVWTYWLVSDGNVWKGRFNKDGWLRKE